MPVIGEPPHPQALFVGFTEDDDAYRAMTRLVATAKIMPPDPQRQLRLAEWDIVVSWGGSINNVGHLHGISFGGSAMVRIGRINTFLQYEARQPSRILHIEDDLPTNLKRLVTDDLVPWLRAQKLVPVLTYSNPSVSSPGGLPTNGPSVKIASSKGASNFWSGLTPFVRDADGAVIAGAFTNTDSGQIWILPHMPEHPERWLVAALEQWHDVTPNRVPVGQPWRVRSEWSTLREGTLRGQLEDISTKREQALAEFCATESDLEAQLVAATADADSGARVLLTGTGEELVDAVVRTLEEFGFSVEDVDTELEAGQAKVEDLRVTDPDDMSRTNITEVKGYAGGAKTSDLAKMSRYAALYTQRTGSPPASAWYVVNQFKDADPDSRQQVLAGADEDVDEFAQAGGVVIDTRVMFMLQRMVNLGKMTSAQVRALLASATGRLELPDQ